MKEPCSKCLKEKKILTRSADLSEFYRMLTHGYQAIKCPICRWYSIEKREYEHSVHRRSYLVRFYMWLGSKKFRGGQ